MVGCEPDCLPMCDYCVHGERSEGRRPGEDPFSGWCRLRKVSVGNIDHCEEYFHCVAAPPYTPDPRVEAEALAAGERGVVRS